MIPMLLYDTFYDNLYATFYDTYDTFMICAFYDIIWYDTSMILGLLLWSVFSLSQIKCNCRFI